MKKKISLLFVLFTLLILNGCEEVVEIYLEESAPRLVIEASFIWDNDQQELPLFIYLSQTAPYFADKTPPAQDALITVSTENGDEYVFEEVEPGIYKNEGFTPFPGIEYDLEIVYREEIYRATEKLVSVPELEYVEQVDNGGFTGENIELKAFYTDPAGIDNYYLFHFAHEKLSLQIYNDEFTDGNTTFAFFSDEELESGDQVIFQIQGISQRFYEYMFILSSQAGTSGGPFQTRPTVAKGNIINITNPENYALGYFRLSQSDLLSYQVK